MTFLDQMVNEVLYIVQPLDLCNLNCKYCYLPGRKDPKVMDFDVLESFVKKIYQSNLSKTATVCWHVSEPLTAKLPFFEKAMEIFSTHKKDNVFIKQSIQTNATLINEDWIRFFKKHRIKVTLSVDGPKFIHDRHRVNWKGKGSHDLVQRGIDKLRSSEMLLAAICVISDFSLDYPDEIFNYFVENQFTWIGLSPEELEANNTSSSLDISPQYTDPT